MPGAHVICANKSATEPGPTWMWAAIALAIADDRESAANLFIEDCGNYGDGSTPEKEVVQFFEKTRHYIGTDSRPLITSVVR